MFLYDRTYDKSNGEIENERKRWKIHTLSKILFYDRWEEKNLQNCSSDSKLVIAEKMYEETVNLLQAKL